MHAEGSLRTLRMFLTSALFAPTVDISSKRGLGRKCLPEYSARRLEARLELELGHGWAAVPVLRA